jgi:hypothetical protein
VQDSSVGWDPITIDRHMAWQDKLFILYLLLVVGMLIVRSLNMARQFWFAGPLSKGSKQEDAPFLYAWEMCNAKAAGMKRMAILTLLLTLLMLTNGVTDILVGVAQEKRIWEGAVAGGLAEVGGLLTLGVFVGAVLYGIASLYEGILARRRASWNYSRSNDRVS